MFYEKMLRHCREEGAWRVETLEMLLTVPDENSRRIFRNLSLNRDRYFITDAPQAPG